MFAGNCQKNLIKKHCSSCGDVCISVDENILDTCTSNITNLLVSEEGMNIFESYLRACDFSLSVEQLELWRKSIVVLPYNNRDSDVYVWNWFICSDIHIDLFAFLRGVDSSNISVFKISGTIQTAWTMRRQKCSTICSFSRTENTRHTRKISYTMSGCYKIQFTIHWLNTMASSSKSC